MTEHVKEVRITDDANQAVAADSGTVDCCARGTAPTEQTYRQHIESAARDTWSFFVDTLPYLILGMVIGALIHGVVLVDVL
nr:hypothetical protein [Halococcus salsus]